MLKRVVENPQNMKNNVFSKRTARNLIGFGEILKQTSGSTSPDKRFDRYRARSRAVSTWVRSRCIKI